MNPAPCWNADRVGEPVTRGEFWRVVRSDRSDRVGGEPSVDGQLCAQSRLRVSARYFRGAKFSRDTFDGGVEGTGSVSAQDTLGFPMPELATI
jgi:hypothetical protein